MNKLDAELAHTGEDTTLSPTMLMLEQLRTTKNRCASTARPPSDASPTPRYPRKPTTFLIPPTD